MRSVAPCSRARGHPGAFHAFSGTRPKGLPVARARVVHIRREFRRQPKRTFESLDLGMTI